MNGCCAVFLDMEFGRCGARTRFGTRCRQYRAAGRKRCRRHGGLSTGARQPLGWPRRAHEQHMVRHGILRALGLPWYGGAPKKKVTLSMAEKAIVALDEVVELMPAPRDAPDDQKGDLEIFGEGVRASCILLRDTVYLGLRVMRDGEGNELSSVAEMHPQDLKLLGMAQITALGVTKQGFKAADRAQRNDIIGQLLAQIAAEQKAGGKP